jgi:hypothetical protein
MTELTGGLRLADRIGGISLACVCVVSAWLLSVKIKAAQISRVGYTKLTPKLETMMRWWV